MSLEESLAEFQQARSVNRSRPKFVDAELPGSWLPEIASRVSNQVNGSSRDWTDQIRRGTGDFLAAIGGDFLMATDTAIAVI